MIILFFIWVTHDKHLNKKKLKLDGGGVNWQFCGILIITNLRCTPTIIVKSKGCFSNYDLKTVAEFMYIIDRILWDLWNSTQISMR